MEFEYTDENGVTVAGEFLYETTIDGKDYALCNLHYGPDNNTVCACKVIRNGEEKTFARLDSTDNVEAITAQLQELLMGDE